MTELRVPKLLAIDDEPQSLGLIKDALSDLPLEILTADGARTGLEIFKRARPQIVLLDLMMPGVRGWEMLEWIMAADPGAEVILMTAHYSTESAVEAIQKGACDYLNKPVSVEKLRRRISLLLSEADRSAHTKFRLAPTHIRAFIFPVISRTSARNLRARSPHSAMR